MPTNRLASSQPLSCTHNRADIGPVSSVSSGADQVKAAARERVPDVTLPEADDCCVASAPLPGRWSDRQRAGERPFGFFP
jgi:hypothetical protein